MSLFRGRTNKRITYILCYGGSPSKLAKQYGWRLIKVQLKLVLIADRQALEHSLVYGRIA